MLHLLLLTYPGEFKGNVKKWQRESKKNFDSFFKLANRDPRPGEFVTKYELLSLQADPRVGMFRERDDLAELYHQREVLERYTQRAS